MSRALEVLRNESLKLQEELNDNKLKILKLMDVCEGLRLENSEKQVEIDYLNSIITSIEEAEKEVMSEQE